jgi:hypothetical protein
MVAEAGVWCFIVCFGSLGQPPVPVDTYCQTYQQVVRKREELGEVTKLSRPIRDRIQGNDLDYLCRCKGLRIKECQGSTQR